MIGIHVCSFKTESFCCIVNDRKATSVKIHLTRKIMKTQRAVPQYRSVLSSSFGVNGIHLRSASLRRSSSLSKNFRRAAMFDPLNARYDPRTLWSHP